MLDQLLDNGGVFRRMSGDVRGMVRAQVDGLGRRWTRRMCMAWKGSGVRIPSAPPTVAHRWLAHWSADGRPNEKRSLSRVAREGLRRHFAYWKAAGHGPKGPPGWVGVWSRRTGTPDNPECLFVCVTAGSGHFATHIEPWLAGESLADHDRNGRGHRGTAASAASNAPPRGIHARPGVARVRLKGPANHGPGRGARVTRRQRRPGLGHARA